MKKQSFRRPNAGLLESRAGTLGAAVLACVVLIVIVRLLLPDAFFAGAAPLLRGGSVVTESLHGFLGSFSDAQALALERDRLTAANVALADENRARIKRGKWRQLHPLVRSSIFSFAV